MTEGAFDATTSFLIMTEGENGATFSFLILSDSEDGVTIAILLYLTGRFYTKQRENENIALGNVVTILLCKCFALKTLHHNPLVANE